MGGRQPKEGLVCPRKSLGPPVCPLCWLCLYFPVRAVALSVPGEHSATEPHRPFVPLPGVSLRGGIQQDGTGQAPGSPVSSAHVHVGCGLCGSHSSVWQLAPSGLPSGHMGRACSCAHGVSGRCWSFAESGARWVRVEGWPSIPVRSPGQKLPESWPSCAQKPQGGGPLSLRHSCDTGRVLPFHGCG